MSFEEILGQDHIVKRIESSIKSGRLAHGFIFAGPGGSGKTTLALALARRLLCDRDAAHSCTCPQCSKLKLDDENQVSHGDVYILAPKVQTIRVEDVRNELIDRVQLHPVEGKYKFFIMQEAERMAPAASNAFLKTLEEPPTDTVIILESRRPELLLETIRSRCHTYRLAPLGEDTFLRELRGRKPETAVADAQALWRFTGGSLGEALRLCEEDWLQRAKEFLQLLESDGGIDPFEVAEKAARSSSGSTLEEQRREVSALIDFAVESLREKLRSACSGKSENALEETAGTEKSIDQLLAAKQLIRSNVRVESILERLARRFSTA